MGVSTVVFFFSRAHGKVYISCRTPEGFLSFYTLSIKIKICGLNTGVLMLLMLQCRTSNVVVCIKFCGYSIGRPTYVCDVQVSANLWPYLSYKSSIYSWVEKSDFLQQVERQVIRHLLGISIERETQTNNLVGYIKWIALILSNGYARDLHGIVYGRMQWS